MASSGLKRVVFGKPPETTTHLCTYRPSKQVPALGNAPLPVGGRCSQTSPFPSAKGQQDSLFPNTVPLSRACTCGMARPEKEKAPWCQASVKWYVNSWVCTISTLADNNSHSWLFSMKPLTTGKLVFSALGSDPRLSYHWQGEILLLPAGRTSTYHSLGDHCHKPVLSLIKIKKAILLNLFLNADTVISLNSGGTEKQKQWALKIKIKKPNTYCLKKA